MKKSTKLFLSLSMLFSVGFSTVACGGDPDDGLTAEEKVDEAYDLLVYDGLDAIVASFDLYNQLDEVVITYTSSNDAFLAINETNDRAIVTQPTKGSTEKGYELITLTAHLSLEDVSKDKNFAVKVLEKGDEKTVAEVVATTTENKDNAVTLKAIVVGLGDGCALVGDNTGVILVYSSSAVEGLAVGDYVKIDGSISFYQNVPQFAYSAAVPVTVTKLSETPDFEYSAPAVENWDAAKVSAYMDYTSANQLLGNRVKVQGSLAINGKYYNVTIPGITKGNGASICYPNEELKTQLAALDGKFIDITGYTLYISHDYMYLFVESVAEASVDESAQLDAAVAALEIEGKVNADFILPKAGLYNSTITWTSSNTEVISIGAATDAGYPATVKATNTEVEVTLTASVTLGSLEPKTKDFVVKVQLQQSLTTTFPVKTFAELSSLATTDTTNKYYAIGYVKEIANTQFGNMYIENEAGETFYIYGVYNVDGSVRFDAMGEDQPVVGDIVVLYGVLSVFKDVPQMKNGWLVQRNATVFDAPSHPVTGINAPANLEVVLNQTASIGAAVEPSNADEKGLTYVSNDTAIATVDEAGVVTGVAAGDTTITITSVADANITATVAIHVVETATVHDTLTLTIDALGVASQSYVGTADALGTATIDNVPFSFNQLGNFGNGIQWRKNSDSKGAGSIWNTAAFEKGISKIEFTYNASQANYSNADALKVDFGTDDTCGAYSTTLSTVKGQTAYTITPDAETYTFVRMTNNINYALYFDSIVIYFAA